jgi:hypothetical protein
MLPISSKLVHPFTTALVSFCLCEHCLRFVSVWMLCPVCQEFFFLLDPVAECFLSVTFRVYQAIPADE